MISFQPHHEVDGGISALSVTARVWPVAGDVPAMNRLWQLLLFTTCLSLSSCCSVQDRRTAPEICVVHHSQMHAEMFRKRAIVTPTSEYAEARLRLFPNIPPQGPPVFWPWSRQRVYVCDHCVAAEAEWSKQQKSRANPRASQHAANVQAAARMPGHRGSEPVHWPTSTPHI